MTGHEFAAAKAAAPVVAKHIGGPLRRRLWPDTSRISLMTIADTLADAVARDERVLLDQLGGGPGTVMDVKFDALSRFRMADAPSADVLSNIGPMFRQQAFPERWVVLGEAGAGKTVLANHLLLDQIKYRAASPDNARVDMPIPVRVSAAGWDGSSDFSRWMAARLKLQPRVARALVDTGRILPFLDGLDEMDAVDSDPRRAIAVLDRLNEPPWRNRGVVIMCRSDFYRRVQALRGDAGLHGAAILTVQPLSPDDIDSYLRAYREQLGVPDNAWAAVTAQVVEHPDGPLATTLRTPLFLGLAATALRRDPLAAKQLATCRDGSQIANLLFANMIPAAIQGTARRGATGRYTESRVQAWMQHFATHLQQQRIKGMGGTEITLDEIWALAGPRRCRRLHRLIGWLLTGLLAGVYVWLSYALTHTLPDGLLVGLPGSLIVGLFIGLVYLIGQRRPLPPARLARRVPGRVRWRMALGNGITYSLGWWLISAPILAVIGHIHLDVWERFGGAIGIGLVMALSSGLRTTDVDRLVLGQDAKRVIHDDLVAGLGMGLVFVVVGGLVGVGSFGAIGGIGFGLLFALIFGYLPVPSAVGRYATASLIFHRTGKFPARPAQFLEWARHAGLIRVSGIAYQCRHDSYQRWLEDFSTHQNGLPSSTWS